MESKTAYILWAQDVLEKEKNFCGGYLTREEAEKEQLMRKEEAWEQYDVLSHIFIVEETTLEEMLKVRRLHNKKENERDKERQYNYDVLKSATEGLLKELRTGFASLSEEDFKTEEMPKELLCARYVNESREDCYKHIKYRILVLNTEELLFNYEVEFKEMKYRHGGYISVSDHKADAKTFKKWLRSSKCHGIILNRTVELICKFFGED